MKTGSSSLIAIVITLRIIFISILFLFIFRSSCILTILSFIFPRCPVDFWTWTWDSGLWTHWTQHDPFRMPQCGKDACGCVQDLLIPRGVSNPQPTKYSLSNARESLYLNVCYESLSVKLTIPDSEMKSPKMSGCRNIECGLPEFWK